MHIAVAGNIGSGNACTALAMLLNTFIDMSVPSVRLLNIEYSRLLIESDHCEKILDHQVHSVNFLSNVLHELFIQLDRHIFLSVQ